MSKKPSAPQPGEQGRPIRPRLTSDSRHPAPGTRAFDTEMEGEAADVCDLLPYERAALPPDDG